MRAHARFIAPWGHGNWIVPELGDAMRPRNFRELPWGQNVPRLDMETQRADPKARPSFRLIRASASLLPPP